MLGCKTDKSWSPPGRTGQRANDMKNCRRFHGKLITPRHIKRNSGKLLRGPQPPRLVRRATFKAEVMWSLTSPDPVVSNVPSNITMTVIAALINAGPTASRRPVTPPGFNAILSGVADRSRPLPQMRNVACTSLLRRDDIKLSIHAALALYSRLRRE